VSKITLSAKGEQCTVRIPGVCNFNNETVIFAHLNNMRFGHGTGIKTLLGAYCCSACHDTIDSRTNPPAGMSNDDIKLSHYEAVFETLLKLNKKGLIKL
jgi:hypothetical protein